MTIKVESMKFEDLEKVTEVQKRSYTSDLLEDLHVFQNRFKKFGEFFLVAKVDDKIVGYAICFPWKLGEIPLNNKNFEHHLPVADCFYLHDICLLEESRGLGIANMLLNQIFEEGSKAGFHNLSLVSVKQSGSYWDRGGFEEIPSSLEFKEKLLSSYGEAARLMSKKI